MLLDQLLQALRLAFEEFLQQVQLGPGAEHNLTHFLLSYLRTVSRASCLAARLI